MSKSDKNKIWAKEKASVDKITDRLGLKIDDGIKDCVIALRLLGLNTTASHEGKIDRYPIPYIDLASPNIGKFMEKRDEIICRLQTPEEKETEKEIDHLYHKLNELDSNDEFQVEKIKKSIKELTSKYKDFKFPASAEIEEIDKKIISENFETEKKIELLLEEFYKNRVSPKEARLQINVSYLGEIRLKSSGAEIQENETDGETKLNRLKLFQNEMADFTNFLKNKFISLP